MGAPIFALSAWCLVTILFQVHGAQLHSCPGELSLSNFLSADAICTRGGNFDYPKCAPGFWCVGSSPSRCKRKSHLYGPCGTEYQECGQLLMCRDNKCIRRPFQKEMYLESGQECSEFSHKKCLPGRWCVNGICARLSPCGATCDPPKVLCRPGLRCTVTRSSTTKVCVRDSRRKRVPMLQEGDTCSFNPGVAKCRGGTRCVQEAGTMTCQTTRHVGEKCAVSQQCELDRTCATVRGKMVCVVERDYGDSCDPDHLAICSKGLVCFSGECSQPDESRHARDVSA